MASKRLGCLLALVTKIPVWEPWRTIALNGGQ